MKAGLLWHWPSAAQRLHSPSSGCLLVGSPGTCGIIAGSVPGSSSRSGKLVTLGGRSSALTFRRFGSEAAKRSCLPGDGGVLLTCIRRAPMAMASTAASPASFGSPLCPRRIGFAIDERGIHMNGVGR